MLKNWHASHFKSVSKNLLTIDLSPYYPLPAHIGKDKAREQYWERKAFETIRNIEQIWRNRFCKEVLEIFNEFYSLILSVIFLYICRRGDFFQATLAHHAEGIFLICPYSRLLVCLFMSHPLTKWKTIEHWN